MYSTAVLQHFDNPQGMGSLQDAEVMGQAGIRDAGPWMVLYLRCREDTIQEARYETYPCPAAIACGSWLTQWIGGKTFEVAAAIEPGDLSAVLGGLPLGKEHCAQLAIEALRSALRQYSPKQL